MADWTAWLAPVVKWIVGGLLITALMRWLARGQAERPAFSVDGAVLRHSGSMFVLGAVGTVFFSGCAWFSFFSRTGGAGVAALFAGFTLMSAYVLVEYFVARYEVRHDGLRYRDVLGGRGVARWDEIATVRYAESMKWFVVRTHDGRTIRLSVLLRGLPQFAESVLDRVRPAVVEREAVDVLRATAAGDPPSAWS